MTTTIMDAEQQQDKPCRLCLENITLNEIRCGIDIRQNNDVRKLLQEVYEVQIPSDDSSSTMLCMPCYQQLVNDYKFRMKLFTCRKTFKLNQTMLIAQLITFRNTSEQRARSKTDENSFPSLREKSTQTEAPKPQERRIPTTTKPVENGCEESNVEQPTGTPVNPTCEKQLVPAVADCLKEPLYLKALSHLIVSTNPNDPAPMMFICNCCYEKFNSKGNLEQHKSMGCVPSCRYCLSEQTAEHSCLHKKECSAVMPYILGSQKYVSTYATSNEISENKADESVVGEELEETIEPKIKKKKLDANHNGQDLPSPRRSSTPYPRKGEKNHTAREMQSESETTTTDVRTPSVITLSSSEDELPAMIKIDRKPASKVRSKSKKRRR